MVYPVHDYKEFRKNLVTDKSFSQFFRDTFKKKKLSDKQKSFSIYCIYQKSTFMRSPSSAFHFSK